ncbi:MAG: TetR family transcriptional regulator C-terminal domain-containing protein [Paracoccaceae bacterium]|nr:TetR family transcriptional regulator C-terminal domain-containing protein [Paracoccaceae bacterium]
MAARIQKDKPIAGRTASKEVRRRQLIEATITSISKHGISGTTLTTVTKEAGLSLGLVNFHFETKENLFEQTLRYLAEEHHANWKRCFEQADLAAAEKLKAIVDSHFHPKISTRKKMTVWFGFYGETGSRKSYRTIVKDIDRERWDIALRLCEEIIRDGNYDMLDAHAVAETLEALYDGFWLNILMYPGDFTRADGRRLILGYLAQTFPKHFEATAVA